jgi:hypothetical protein
MGRQHASHDDGISSVLPVDSPGREHDAFEGEPRLGDAGCTDGTAVFEMNAGVSRPGCRKQIDRKTGSDGVSGARRNEQSQSGKLTESASTTELGPTTGTVFVYDQDDIFSGKRLEGQLVDFTGAHGGLPVRARRHEMDSQLVGSRDPA